MLVTERVDTEMSTSWPLGFAAFKLLVFSQSSGLRGKSLTKLEIGSTVLPPANGQEVNAWVFALSVSTSWSVFFNGGGLILFFFHFALYVTATDPPWRIPPQLLLCPASYLAASKRVPHWHSQLSALVDKRTKQLEPASSCKRMPQSGLWLRSTVTGTKHPAGHLLPAIRMFLPVVCCCCGCTVFACFFIRVFVLAQF